mgnify:CR=1 FL=1
MVYINSISDILPVENASLVGEWLGASWRTRQNRCYLCVCHTPKVWHALLVCLEKFLWLGAGLRQCWAERRRNVAGMDRICAGKLRASRGPTSGYLTGSNFGYTGVVCTWECKGKKRRAHIVSTNLGPVNFGIKTIVFLLNSSKNNVNKITIHIHNTHSFRPCFLTCPCRPWTFELTRRRGNDVNSLNLTYNLNVCDTTIMTPWRWRT